MSYLFFSDLDSLHMEWCGMAIVPQGWVHQRRTMDTTVLILGEHGIIKLIEEGNELTVEPGVACVLAAGRTHEGLTPCREPVRYFWLHFQSPEPPKELSEAEATQILSHPEIARQRLANGLLLPRVLSLENSSSLRAPFQNLLTVQESSPMTPLAFQYHARLLLITFNQLVLDQLAPGPAEGPSNLASRMVQIIHEHLSDLNFSVKTLASELGYHPDHLNRHFRTVMHQTLKDYIVDRRVDLAAKYLRDTANTMLEIGQKAGFTSYRNFVHQFSHRRSLTPSEYRRRQLLMQITN